MVESNQDRNLASVPELAGFEASDTDAQRYVGAGSVSTETRGTYAIRYLDMRYDGGIRPETTIDIVPGLTAQQAVVEARYHQACCWLEGRKFFPVRIV